MRLLEMSVSGAIFILAVIVVRAVAVNCLPKKTFLVLWGIVLVQLLLPIRIPSVISIYSWMPQYVEDSAVQQPVRVQSQVDGIEGTDRSMDANQRDYGDKNRLASNVKSVDLKIMHLFVSGYHIHIWKVIWACGFSLCLFCYIIAYLSCRMRFRTSVTVNNEFVKDWLRQYSGRRPVRICQTGFVKAPLTYGLLHPVILMPENTEWEDTRRLAYILAHEAVHIKRFDTVTKFILAAALAVHWFNPMVWIMYILCSRDLELSCDETVVRTFGEAERAEYARLLIYMEEKKSMLEPFYSHFSSHAMQERILAVMKIRERSMKTAAAAAILVCMLAGMFATSSAASKGQQVMITSAVLKEQTAQITNISLNLGSRRAEDISDTLIARLQKQYEGRYDLQNYEVTFCKEVVQGDTLSLDIDLSADMTLVRNPNDSAYVAGMRKAVDKITDAEKKKEAEALYKGYLDEVMSYYMQPERTGFSFQVHLPAASAGDEAKAPVYELFYRGEDGTLAVLEDEEPVYEEILDEEDGMAYIDENLF